MDATKQAFWEHMAEIMGVDDGKPTKHLNINAGISDDPMAAERAILQAGMGESEHLGTVHMGAKMNESLTTIPTDFYNEDGFLISISLPSHPRPSDTIVLNGEMYTVQKLAWDFDVGGIPLLVRINVE